MENILRWLWLTMASGNSDITALLEQFDTIDEIYECKDFSDFRGIKPMARSRLKNKSLKRAEKVFNYVTGIGARVLTFDDINYPDSLRTIPNPPYVLYVLGEMMKWDRLLPIGVVGTRECTDYGTEAARKICRGLAENGVTVVSGMAEGIDGAAARSAISAGNKTIAVLGCGIDIAYPAFHKNLMKEISENGAVITEYPPGTPPYGRNFPWRNRIISGLSRGIVVIEAPKKSGALITADFALEQGKDIFAVPGSIFKATCEGSNELLSKYAKSVTCAEDILEEYVFDIERLNIKKPEKKGFKITFKNKKPENVNNEIKIDLDDKRYQPLSDDERKIIMLLIESNLHIDDIKRKSGFDISKLTPILSMLEFGGYIQKIPGNNYKINL